MNTTTTATEPTPLCPLCRALHAGPCADGALLAAAIGKATTAKALAPIVGYTAESITRARKHDPVVVPPAVRANLVRYLRGEPVTPLPPVKGKRPKRVADLARADSAQPRIQVQLPPEIDGTVTQIVAADLTRPTRATVVRALLVEALTARGYDLHTGAVPEKARPVDPDLAARRQTDPVSPVRVPVEVATAIEHAADHAPVPHGAPPVSRGAMVRALVGEAILGRGIDPWTGEPTGNGTK